MRRSALISVLLAACSAPGAGDGGGGDPSGADASTTAAPASTSAATAGVGTTSGTGGTAATGTSSGSGGTSGTGGMGGAPSSGDAGGAGGLPPCTGYPTSPIGVEEGDVLDPEIELPGLLEREDATTSTRFGDLRDCDGRTGVDAVLLIGARASCSTCRAEAEHLAEDVAAWGALGIRTVILMGDGDIAAWRDRYDLDDAAILRNMFHVLDLPEPPPPESGGMHTTPNGTPLYVVLDPRTGRIVERHLGADWEPETLIRLAADNANGD